MGGWEGGSHKLRNCQELGGGPGTPPSLGPLEGGQPCSTLVLDLWPPAVGSIIFVVQAIQSVALCYSRKWVPHSILYS